MLHKCVTANTSVIWQHAAHTTDQLLLAAKQEPYKKASLLMKNFGRIFWEMFSDQHAEKKDKTERITGLGRRRRKEIVKRN